MDEFKGTTMQTDFINIESKSQLQLNKMIVKYNNKLQTIRKQNRGNYLPWIELKRVMRPTPYYDEVMKGKKTTYYNGKHKEKLRRYMSELQDNIERAEKLYETRKEELKVEQKKNYSADLRETVVCSCGATVTKRNIAKHKKSNSHKSKEEESRSHLNV